MKKVAEVITRIGGRRSKNGYGVLCQVVEAALRDMPEERSIGALCAEVGQRCGKKGETIYKALARAVRDIWENGDRQALEQVAGCRFREEPSPKELVMELVQALWDQEAPVEYHVLDGGLEKKYGIWVQSSGEAFTAMAPFTRDREAVSRLVERWNREQLPIGQFREMILLGELMED